MNVPCDQTCSVVNQGKVCRETENSPYIKWSVKEKLRVQGDKRIGKVVNNIHYNILQVLPEARIHQTLAVTTRMMNRNKNYNIYLYVTLLEYIYTLNIKNMVLTTFLQQYWNLVFFHCRQKLSL